MPSGGTLKAIPTAGVTDEADMVIALDPIVQQGKLLGHELMRIPMRDLALSPGPSQLVKIVDEKALTADTL